MIVPLAESERDGEEATQWNSNFLKRRTKALECVCVCERFIRFIN